MRESKKRIKILEREHEEESGTCREPSAGERDADEQSTHGYLFLTLRRPYGSQGVVSSARHCKLASFDLINDTLLRSARVFALVTHVRTHR